MGHEDLRMFNFDPFSSNRPGATRAHLLDEDGRLAGVVSFTLDQDFVRVAAEVFHPERFHGLRHSAAMVWGDGRVLVADEVPTPPAHRDPPPPAWAFWRAA